MKVLSIKINEKTYLTGKVTLRMTKEAMKIQRDTMAFAKEMQALKAEEMQTDIDAADDILDKLSDLTNRKILLLCNVYDGKFTVDEVEDHLSQEELNLEINKIIRGVSGTVEKN